jgi:hypothetical protein
MLISMLMPLEYCKQFVDSTTTMSEESPQAWQIQPHDSSETGDAKKSSWYMSIGHSTGGAKQKHWTA